MAARWSLAVVGSGAAFVVTWWACQDQARLDETVSLAVAGAVLVLVLAVAGWWASREHLGADDSAAGERRVVVQKVRAGRDANVAGRDQTIINYRRRDE